MVKITKVYTKTGDKGETSLAGKVRVAKCDARIEVIGALDELNSMLGVVVASVEGGRNFSDLAQRIERVQNELFDLGAGLSVVDKSVTYLSVERVETLEHEIDEMNIHLPVLHSFILPGGSQIAAQLQFARSICRRAERNLVKLAGNTKIEKFAIPYVNRLSDWLFVLARFVNVQLKIEEPLWEPSTFS